MPEQLSIAVASQSTTGLVYAAAADRRLASTLVLAHGAGAAQSSRFMVDFARGLATRGLDVLTFNFLYMEQRRKMPDRPAALDACYRAAIDAARSMPQLTENRMFIGGKSMGGRIGSQLAAGADGYAQSLSGLVLLGYPLHPPGKPDQLRTAHLPHIRVPVLIVQGERDPLGSPDEIRSHFSVLGERVTIHAVAGGDHSLAVRRSHKDSPPGETRRGDDHYSRLYDTIAVWVANVA
jgi:predicted alpha/beta-hydrolase family hydrolase